MNEIIKKLDGLKPTKKTEKQDCAELLIKLYEQGGDKKIIAKYFCDFHVDVCKYFFESDTILNLKVNQIKSVYKAICADEQYKKNSRQKGTSLGYVIAGVLIKNEKKFGKEVLINTIKDAKKSKVKADKSKDLLKKYVADYCREEFSLDSESGDDAQKEKIHDFFESVKAENKKLYSKSSKSDSKKEKLENSDSETLEIKADKLTSEKNVSVNNDNLKSEIDMFVKNAQKANGDMQTLLQSIANAADIISSVNNKTENSEQVEVLNNEIFVLKEEIKKETKKRDELVAQLQFDNDDLTARLTRTLNLDEAENNRKLSALRANLSKAIKLEYQDYQENKEKEYSIEQFEIYKASLFKIFKTLKRFDINLD